MYVICISISLEISYRKDFTKKFQASLSWNIYSIFA